MSNQFGIPGEVLNEIIARDKICTYCRGEIGYYPKVPNGSSKQATIEHLNFDGPFYWNKGLEKADLVICCRSCNSSRGKKKLYNWLRSAYCSKKKITENTVAIPVQEYLRRVNN